METVLLVTRRSLLLSRQGPPSLRAGGPPPCTPGTAQTPRSGEGHGEGADVHRQAGGVGCAAPTGQLPSCPLQHGRPSLSLVWLVVPGRAAHACTRMDMHASLHSGAAQSCPHSPWGRCPCTSAVTAACTHAQGPGWHWGHGCLAASPPSTARGAECATAEPPTAAPRAPQGGLSAALSS